MDFSSSPVRFLKKKEPIYQISTLQSLVMGNYYGGVSVEQLLLHGDTGLGMFAAADGELVMLRHQCYRILGDGSAVLAAPTERVTFASVSFLEEGEHIGFGHVGSLEELRAALASLDSALAAVRASLGQAVVSGCISDAREALSRITGGDRSEDLLHEIFGKFCIGK